jgi:hypothetical protein
LDPIDRSSRTPQRKENKGKMAEKRKPELVFIAVWQGNYESTRKKRIAKIELFPASLWRPKAMFGAGRQSGLMYHETRGDVYRIRVNGKWYKPKGRQTFTLSEVFSNFRRSIKLPGVQYTRLNHSWVYRTKPRIGSIPCKSLVRPEGFEPSTLGSEDSRLRSLA